MNGYIQGGLALAVAEVLFGIIGVHGPTTILISLASAIGFGSNVLSTLIILVLAVLAVLYFNSRSTPDSSVPSRTFCRSCEKPTTEPVLGHVTGSKSFPRKCQLNSLDTADDATLSLERLYNKLERKRAVEQTNLEAGKRLKKEIAEQLNEISDHIDVFRKDHASFCEAQRMKLDEFVDEKAEAINTFLENMNDVYNHLKNVCSESLTMVQNQHKSILSQQKAQEITLEKCKKSLEILNKVVGKIVDVELTEVLDKLGSMQLNMDELVMDFKNQMTSLLNSMKANKVEGANIQSVHEKLVASADEKNYAVARLYQRGLTVLWESSKKLKQQVIDSRESVSQIEIILTEGQTKLKSGIDSFQHKFESLQQDVTKSTETIVSDCETRTKEFLEADTSFVKNTQDALQDHCVQIDEWSEGQRSSVYEQAGKVREFWDSTYLVDKPTGATPHRQAYSYP